MTGRTAELKYLDEFYEKSGSHILVVYGQRHIGKTSLLREFVKSRPCRYYMARPCSEREHRLRLYAAVTGSAEENEKSFAAIISAMPKHRGSGKRILIIEEFQNIVKVSQDFIRELASGLYNDASGPETFVILCSSLVGWVENSMLSRLGKAAYALSGLYKIKEVEFGSIKEYFPGFDGAQCVEAYAVLGGMPGLWQYFDDTLTIRENICRNILNPSAFLYDQAERFVEAGLRETGVYNTILATLASGRRKLNELYLYTGFSRAKISVYLKTLMELELVEKIFSFDSDGRDNARKGIYRIRNHFVNFYFTCVYPDGEKLFSMSPEEYYDTYIAPGFGRYTEEYYKKVCMQYIEGLNRAGELPLACVKMGEWAGKTGDIDIVAQDGHGRTLIGKCSWERSCFSYGEYRRLLLCAKRARIRPDYVCLFSSGSFDERLVEEAGKSENLLLFGPDRI